MEHVWLLAIATTISSLVSGVDIGDGLTTGSTTASECPLYWSSFDRETHPKDGKCLKVLTGVATWNEARTFCEGVGGDLVIISSQEFYTFIKDIVAADGSDDYFVGLHDLTTEGQIESIHGTRPDSSIVIAGNTEDKDCVVLHHKTTAATVVDCFQKAHFICQNSPDAEEDQKPSPISVTLRTGFAHVSHFITKRGQVIHFQIYVETSHHKFGFKLTRGEKDVVEVGAKYYSAEYNKVTETGGYVNFISFDITEKQLSCEEDGPYTLNMDNGHEVALDYLFRVIVQDKPALCPGQESDQYFELEEEMDTVRLSLCIKSYPTPTLFRLEKDGADLKDNIKKIDVKQLCPPLVELDLTLINVDKDELKGNCNLTVGNGVLPNLVYDFYLKITESTKAYPKILWNGVKTLQSATLYLTGGRQNATAECEITGVRTTLSHVEFQCGGLSRYTHGSKQLAIHLVVNVSLVHTSCRCEANHLTDFKEYVELHFNVTDGPIFQKSETGHREFYTWKGIVNYIAIKILSYPGPTEYRVTKGGKPVKEFMVTYMADNANPSFGTIRVSFEFVNQTGGLYNLRISNGLGKPLDFPINISLLSDLSPIKEKEEWPSWLTYTAVAVGVVALGMLAFHVERTCQNNVKGERAEMETEDSSSTESSSIHSLSERTTTRMSSLISLPRRITAEGRQSSQVSAYSQGAWSQTRPSRIP